MLFRQMKYFVTVVECNSFTEAAERCFISQSAISQQIGVLESELGVKLIRRVGRKFELTPAGEYFYQRSKAVLQNVDVIKRETVQIGSDHGRYLNIGYLASYDGTELQSTIVEFAQIHPEVIVNVFKGTHEDLYYALKNGEASLVLNDQRRVFSDEYENFILNQSPAYIDVAITHPLALKDVITIQDLADFACILVAAKKRENTEHDFYENTLGIGKQFLFADSLDEARLMTTGGRGYLLVESIKNEGCPPLVRKEVRRADHSPIVRTYCAFWKKTETTPYIEEFANLLRKSFTVV